MQSEITKACKSLGIDEDKYRKICESIWGAVPYNVQWAAQTEIYKTALKIYNENKQP